jgi:hypothetical protein
VQSVTSQQSPRGLLKEIENEKRKNQTV